MDAVERVEAELTDRQKMDLLALYDARSSTVYGGIFDAFSQEDYTALRGMGLIRSYVPAGCMAPITKLTPKGFKLIDDLLARLTSSDQPKETKMSGPKRGDKLKWVRSLDRRPLAVADLEHVTVASFGEVTPLGVTLQEVAGVFPLGWFDQP